MNKKAQEFMMIILIELVLLSLVGAAIGLYINAVDKNTFLEKVFFADEGKLAIEAVHAVPGNARMHYGNTARDKLKNYDFSIDPTDNEFVLLDGKDKQSRKFGSTVGFSYSSDVPPKSHIFHFLKTDKEVLLTGSKDVNKETKLMQRMACPKTDERITFLFLDAGGSGEEAEFNLAVANYIASNIKLNKDTQVDRTRPTDAEVTLQKRKEKLLVKGNKATLLSITLNNEKKNFARAYIDMYSQYYEYNYAIACEILDSLLTTFPDSIDGVSIVPVNTYFLKKEDPLTLLNPEDPERESKISQAIA